MKCVVSGNYSSNYDSNKATRTENWRHSVNLSMFYPFKMASFKLNESIRGKIILFEYCVWIFEHTSVNNTNHANTDTDVKAPVH